MNEALKIEQLVRDAESARKKIYNLENTNNAIKKDNAAIFSELHLMRLQNEKLINGLTGHIANAVQEAFAQFEVVDVKDDAPPATTTYGVNDNGKL